MEFIDREKELALLLDHLTRPGASLFVLYGRRRIGKTALLAQALQGLSSSAYHVATRSTVVEELGRLSRSLAAGWGMPLIEAQPLTSLAAFMTLLSGAKERAILVLDEFPYLVESETSLPGLLQATWDQSIQHSELKIVLCGSSVGLMEEIFLSQRSPLYGRGTGQLRLGPLPVHSLARAFPWPAAEVVELASLFGGIPGYLRHIDPSLTLLDNLKRFVLQRGEPLYEEVPFLLREELREPRVYYAILATIAGGSRKFGEISSKVGLDRANLTRYLSTLNDLGLVVREVPVTEPNPDKSRKGLYFIADPFIATWFALVAPFRDVIERGALDAHFDGEVLPRINRLLPMAAETMVRELLREGLLGFSVPFEPRAVGRYWSPTAEFDVVLLDASREQALVAEVKWTSRPVDPRVLDDLRRRVAREPAFVGVTCTYCVISRAGFVGDREILPDEYLVDMRTIEWSSGDRGREVKR